MLDFACYNDDDLIEATKASAGEYIRIAIADSFDLGHRNGKTPYIFGTNERPAKSISISWINGAKNNSKASLETSNCFAFVADRIELNNIQIHNYQGGGGVIKSQNENCERWIVNDAVITNAPKASAFLGGKHTRCLVKINNPILAGCATHNTQYHCFYIGAAAVTINNPSTYDCGQVYALQRTGGTKTSAAVVNKGFHTNHGATNFNADINLWEYPSSVWIVRPEAHIIITDCQITGDWKTIYTGHASMSYLAANFNDFSNINPGVIVSKEWKDAVDPIGKQLDSGEWQALGFDTTSVF